MLVRSVSALQTNHSIPRRRSRNERNAASAFIANRKIQPWEPFVRGNYDMTWPSMRSSDWGSI